MPFGPRSALGVAGGIAVCGVVGVVLAGVELVELGEVLVAAYAPVIPAAAPPAASAPATSVVPIIFEMRILRPPVSWGWSRTVILAALAKRRIGGWVGVA